MILCPLSHLNLKKLGKADRMGIIITTLFYRWGVVEERVYNWEPGKALRWGGRSSSFWALPIVFYCFIRKTWWNIITCIIIMNIKEESVGFGVRPQVTFLLHYFFDMGIFTSLNLFSYLKSKANKYNLPGLMWELRKPMHKKHMAQWEAGPRPGSKYSSLHLLGPWEVLDNFFLKLIS